MIDFMLYITPLFLYMLGGMMVVMAVAGLICFIKHGKRYF